MPLHGPCLYLVGRRQEHATTVASLAAYAMTAAMFAAQYQSSFAWGFGPSIHVHSQCIHRCGVRGPQRMRVHFIRSTWMSIHCNGHSIALQLQVYHMPGSSDNFVTAFRTWLSKYGGGGPFGPMDHQWLQVSLLLVSHTCACTTWHTGLHAVSMQGCCWTSLNMLSMGSLFSFDTNGVHCWYTVGLQGTFRLVELVPSGAPFSGTAIAQ